MKTAFLLLVGMVLMGSPAFAASVDGEVCESQISEDVALDETELRSEISQEFFGQWHCTAFPDHGGHGHGHDAYDYNYNRAYQQALRSCQYYHHYCHVHCHYDHH